MDLARKTMGPSGVDFDLINTSFLDSSERDEFYVALDFKHRNAGDRLQVVFLFDAEDGQPRMEWDYSVFNNLAKLKVNGGAFVDDDNARIQRRGEGFDMPIALTPVDYQHQAETIARLCQQGVQMLVSIEGHPELKPFRIVGLTNLGDCLAEYPSRDDALRCAKVLEIKVKE